MEAWYGDYSPSSSNEPYSDADETTYAAGPKHDATPSKPSSTSTPALSLDEIILSTPITDVSHQQVFANPTIEREILVGGISLVLLGGTLAILGVLSAAVAAAAFVVPPLAFALGSASRTWRNEPRSKRVETPDNHAMWHVLLALGEGRLGFVKGRCDDLVRLCSNFGDDRDALQTITRDLRNLVIAFQAAYEFADEEQRRTLRDTLIRSVEGVGVFATREHDALLRSRLDAFDTHRRFIDGKTIDGHDLLAA